jgi:hypothetical protein
MLSTFLFEFFLINTFMRMKEDHMKNGQPNSVYNVTATVDSEYILAAMLSSDQSDSQTLIHWKNRNGLDTRILSQMSD